MGGGRVLILDEGSSSSSSSSFSFFERGDLVEFSFFLGGGRELRKRWMPACLDFFVFDD